jgi:hypothetical protein
MTDVAEAERRVLSLAFNKLVIEAGALPAPGTAYEPHTTAFSIDAATGMGTALDLRFVLAALRGLTAWAGAGPMPAPATATAATAAAPAPATAMSTSAAMTWTAPASARDLRMAARVRGYTATAASATALATPLAAPAMASVIARRPGGCGCRGGTAVSSSPSTRPRRPSRTPDCRDPKPHCDCGGTCGGRGCGCSGTASCTDCIPRGASAGERCGCTCGTCVPPPESCTPWTPSCATRNRLRACLKDILCELLLCIEQALCKDGRLDPDAVKLWRVNLARCFADLFCRALRCIREALCPPPVACPPALPPVDDCIPCSYAVEDPR